MNKVIKEIKKGRDRHWKNFIDRDYLGGHNLENGEDMILTIEKAVGEESVKNHQTNETSTKMVLYFKENVPKMILNITNATTISQLYGNHIQDWEGKKIQLMTARVKAFGKEHDALRIRDIIPKDEMNKQGAINLLNSCKNLGELKKAWTTIPVILRKDADVEVEKESLKDKLK